MGRRCLTTLAVALLLACGQTAAAAGNAEDAAQLRQAFRAQLERPRAPLAVEVIARDRADGVRREHFSFSSDAATRLEAVLHAPDQNSDRRRAVVILLHGTGQGKDSMRDTARAFVARGMAAVAMDARGYRTEPDPDAGRRAYMDSLVHAFSAGGGQPFLFDPAWDVLRLIDYLVTRSDLDPARIGVLGRSKGGMEAVMAAAADERIRAVVPLIGVQSFRYGIENDAWQARARALQPAVDRAAESAGQREVDARFMQAFLERVAPGLTGRFDMPSMLPLIAPRAMLVINGETDARNALPGVMQCVAAARDAYARTGASGEFEFVLQPATGHTVTPAAQAQAVDWLVRKLTAP